MDLEVVKTDLEIVKMDFGDCETDTVMGQIRTDYIRLDRFSQIHADNK